MLYLLLLLFYNCFNNCWMSFHSFDHLTDLIPNIQTITASTTVLSCTIILLFNSYVMLIISKSFEFEFATHQQWHTTVSSLNIFKFCFNIMTEKWTLQYSFYNCCAAMQYHLETKLFTYMIKDKQYLITYQFG